MSCWRRTTVLRVPAVLLGFEYRWEWEEFLETHEEQLDWEPGWFAPALCDSYPREEYAERLAETDVYDPLQRLDLDVFPDKVRPAPGPFLDYYLEEISPLPSEENSYHKNDCARPLTPEEKEKYLPLFRELFPGFTPENMENVHYCRYEWYDGAEAPYFY